jgi:hypothetical protein
LPMDARTSSEPERTFADRAKQKRVGSRPGDAEENQRAFGSRATLPRSRRVGDVLVEDRSSLRVGTVFPKARPEARTSAQFAPMSAGIGPKETTFWPDLKVWVGAGVRARPPRMMPARRWRSGARGASPARHGDHSEHAMTNHPAGLYNVRVSAAVGQDEGPLRKDVACN